MLPKFQGKLQLFVGLRRTFTSIPVIDAQPLVNPQAASSAARKLAAAQLDEACRNVGFFYVKNHGVPPSVYQGVLAEARKWFSLPESMKNEIALSSDKHYRGYQVLGANVTRYDGGFQRDWHEGIDLYKEEDPARIKATGLPPSPIHGPNQWPHHNPEFVKALHDYVDHMSVLGAQLMRGIALGLGLPETTFEGDRASVENGYWCVRVIHYPPLEQGDFHAAVAKGEGLHEQAARALQGAEVDRSVQLSCGEHTDYGLLTLVNQEPGITALQVKNAAGQWINATPIDGTFVCNIGDMLKVWSNGLYQPTAHRVINSNPTKSRVSIPFFYEPCYEAKVEPLPELLQGDKPRYPAVRYGTHLEGKVLKNFEL